MKGFPNNTKSRTRGAVIGEISSRETNKTNKVPSLIDIFT
jgi:hypothetical protein